ncbi:MAG: SET domain-containing protein [Saprospiraceae bacterium]|nr:SET domain-containing protein [Saprospiraceae bacterium]
MPDPIVEVNPREWVPLTQCNKSIELRINPSNQQKGLFAKRFCKEGEVLQKFGASVILDSPTYLTIQINDQQHIELQPEFLQYLNHSCSPNCFPDPDSFQLIALTDINAGEQLCYFYPSTEWKMDQAFDCFCHSADCFQSIKGAYSIDLSKLLRYKISNHILRKKSEYLDS